MEKLDKYIKNLKHGDIIEIWSDTWHEVEKVVFIKMESDETVLVRPLSWDSDGENFAHLTIAKDDIILPD